MSHLHADTWAHRLAREPLLHFVILGLLLFWLYAWLQQGRGTDKDLIVVDAARVQAIESRFESVWRRPPTDAERRGLIDSYVREEILYREGLALRLDRDDPVVRRRVAQKLAFLSEAAMPPTPTEAQLQHWFVTHLSDYRVPASFSLDQLYFSTELAARDDDIAAVLARLRKTDHAWRELGDATLLPTELQAASDIDVAAHFGKDFLTSLETLPTGTWQGPVASTYGLHLVRLQARSATNDPTFDSVRERVERDLNASVARQNEDALYRQLRERYEVRVEAADARATLQVTSR